MRRSRADDDVDCRILQQVQQAGQGRHQIKFALRRQQTDPFLRKGVYTCAVCVCARGPYIRFLAGGGGEAENDCVSSECADGGE